MSNYILMVFEGKKTEPQIVNNLKKYYLNESEKTVVKAVYGTVIYKLYKEFFPDGQLDEDLELFPLLKEQIVDMDGNELKDITREEVSEIHLFFDYDGHASNAGDAKLTEMLNLFNNETENGKLYVSYPMVEAIKHLNNSDNFQNTIVESHKDYKKLVTENCDENFNDLTSLTKHTWKKIINEHLKKANFIVHKGFSFPENRVEQDTIFKKQKETYIDISNKVAVLSSFPLFLFEYYGLKILEG